MERSHYDDYVRTFRTAFKYGKPYQGLAVVTRLLCMKRPDYFVCIDGKNRKNILRAFGLRPSKLKIDTYWEALIEPILEASWWQSKMPRGGLQLEAWNARAAMLDALYYEP